MENNEVTVIAGKCGEDVAFSFDGSVLRISGSGAGAETILLRIEKGNLL